VCAKGLNAKDIHKEMFPIYRGKRMSRKTLHNRVANVSLMTEEVETEVRKWLRKVKRLLCCEFRRTGKAMGQVYERNVFSRFEYHMFYVLYPFVTCLLTLPRIFN
jgi:hypothetical protein